MTVKTQAFEVFKAILLVAQDVASTDKDRAIAILMVKLGVSAEKARALLED